MARNSGNFFNLLASVLLIVLAEPIIRLLFERGEFDSASTGRVTVALVALAPGLVAFSCVNVFARAFYALNDTKTPMKISVFCLVLNVLLTVPLVLFLKEAGLGIANSTTGFVNIALLTFALRKKLKHLDMQSLRRHLVALLLASAVAAVCAWSAHHFWEKNWGHATFVSRLGQVLVPMLAATLAYFAVAFALRVPFAHEAINLVRKRGRR